MNKGKVVIINLQKTPVDDYVDLVIHAKIDDVMSKLMEKLQLEIPQWKLTRYVKIKYEQTVKGDCLSVAGVDKQLEPYDFLKSVKINGVKSKSLVLKPD